MGQSLVSAAGLGSLLGRRDARRAAYIDLATGLRGLILDGRVGLGARLPAERGLAAALQLSRTTVTAAYELLRQEGFLSSRRGAGTFACVPDPEDRRTARAGAGGAGETAPAIDLTIAALPAPTNLIDALGHASDRLRQHLGTRGYDPYGVPELRRAVAEGYSRRGAPTTEDEILITSGAQHALGLVLSVLAGPTDAGLVEVPTWPNALELMRSAGVRPAFVAMSAGGWDLELLAATFKRSPPRLAYVIPDFQNPTGLLMAEPERRELASMARRAASHLVVDETFAELVLDPIPMPRPVPAFDEEGEIIALGSMSKSHWGGLRVGWIRAHRRHIEAMARARALRDGASPVLEQLIAGKLLAPGDDALATRRRRLATQRDALAAALARELPGWHTTVPAGGLSLWVEMDAPISTSLCTAAAEEGINLVPGPRFGAEGTLERFLRIPFILPPAVLEEVVERLAVIARRQLSNRSRRESWYVA